MFLQSQQSYIKTKHFFKNDNNAPLNNSCVIFKLNDYNFFIVYKEKGITLIDVSSIDNLPIDKFTNIILKSHMRDFEVVSNGPVIARGQGLGVIIDFSRNFYIKMWKDKTKKYGVDLFLTNWPTSDIFAAQNILSADLSIGYDVFIIAYDGAEHQLCEKINKDDEKDTLIIFPSLKKYAKYDDDK